MKRPTLNFIIDSAAFVSCLVLLSTGLIMYFILPPGSGHLEIWGMNRHGWGDIHFWAAVLFILMIGIHLVLHWKWIVCKVKGRVTETAQSKLRMAIFIIVLITITAMVSTPFLSPVHDTRSPASAPGIENQADYIHQPD